MWSAHRFDKYLAFCPDYVFAPCKPDLACTAARLGVCKPRVGLDKPCGDGIECTKDLYCVHISEVAGTCKPRPTVGDPCPDVQVGRTWFYTPCLDDVLCARITQGDGGYVNRCVADPAAIGETCGTRFRPCAGGLVCGPDKTCELASCVTDAGTN